MLDIRNRGGQAAATKVRRDGDGIAAAQRDLDRRSDTDPRLAALLGGAAERLRERIAMRPQPADARINKAQLERARAQLHGSAFADSWDEGRLMALDAAVGLALKGAFS